MIILIYIFLMLSPLFSLPLSLLHSLVVMEEAHNSRQIKTQRHPHLIEEAVVFIRSRNKMAGLNAALSLFCENDVYVYVMETMLFVREKKTADIITIEKRQSERSSISISNTYVKQRKSGWRFLV